MTVLSNGYLSLVDLTRGSKGRRSDAYGVRRSSETRSVWAAIVGTFIKRRFSLADSVSRRENQGVSSLAASTGNVISTSRRQISAFVAINVPYQPPIGRNNSVINLVTFREPPSRNGPNGEHGASRFTESLRWEHGISTLSNNQSIPAAVGDYVCS